MRCGWPGTSRARNLGARAAAADAIAFVDDDVRVSPDWAPGLRACLDAHPEVAFITGRITVPEHQRDAHRPVAVADHDRPLEFAGVDTAVLGHGANMAVRRPPFEAVGGFDESFGPGARYRAAEDHDLFDRLLAAGFAGRYEPAVAAEHEQWRQRWALVGLEWAYGVGTGARAWAPQVEAFSADYDVLAPFLPGFGPSPGPFTIPSAVASRRSPKRRGSRARSARALRRS